MPPQQPIVNGYYGYEDVPHIPENGQSLPNDGLPSVTPPEQVRQPSSNPADVFAEYMWMEHEEEFDKQVHPNLQGFGYAARYPTNHPNLFLPLGSILFHRLFSMEHLFVW